jgi:hypothetical protein
MYGAARSWGRRPMLVFYLPIFALVVVATILFRVRPGSSPAGRDQQSLVIFKC